tara:strand:- start:3498 stop:3611 length:114 start_codon:yes stop_codon:yes gene_type:complete
MAGHSRALANVLFKNTLKKGVKKIDVKKEVVKSNSKK